MTEQQTSFDLDKMKDKIAKLLAKAEGTDNQHERDTFTAAAEKLMLRLGIERAELQAAGTVKAEEIVEVHRDWKTIYAPTMGRFAFVIGRGFGNLDFLQSRYGKDNVRTYIIGHKSDVEAFLVLLDSLHLQVWSAVKAFRKENKETRRYYSIHENFVTDRSFIEAYGSTVAARLRAERKVEEKEATPGAALVLASKMDRVEAWKNEQYPNLRKGRTSNAQWSAAGANAGRAAGQNARLGNKGLANTTKSIR